MANEIAEPNACIRGCCRSRTIPLHLPPSSYSLSLPIARGSESVVYEAILRGRKVAVKKPILATSDDLDKFHKELQLLCKLDHPGVAKLVAAHARPPNYMFFFEFYEFGNLAAQLHVEQWSPSTHKVLDVSSKLAKALQYLHTLGIVHRDVKPANVLLDGNLQPHLADFGLAEYKTNLKQVCTQNWTSIGKPTGGFHKRNMVGTFIYMAPEVLRKDIPTEKSDVYSFGISVNELLTGVVPYTDLRTEAQAHTVLEMNYTEQQLTAAVVSESLRPLLAGPNLNVPVSLVSLISRCWDADPRSRPSFDDIIIELDSIMELESELMKGEKESDKHSVTQGYHESINWSTQGEDFAKKSSLNPNSCVGMWDDSPDDPSVYSPVLSWGSFACCGRRETMEDRHFLIPNMCDTQDIHVFGILDGHRGAAAAEFSAGALPEILRSLGSRDRFQCPSKALTESFIQTDIAFRHELSSQKKCKGAIKKDFHPGCTAIVALIVKNKLVVANAGDCKTILCRAGHPYVLSRDHVASCAEERERVTRAGIEVKWQVDTWRVGSAALQVTRSIGDDDLKPAVTAEPEISETILCGDDEYIVMGSDGLWDVVTEEEVVGIIRDTVKEAGMCCKRLATEAAERGSQDNITVIVVFLRPVSTAQRIY
ncbi:unnamed protein product [Cuscuta campestris]|uniref:Protein kinase domain-containing protein n=1 Tax=Cuscuta campestris TaxID=132261 RepID=A0A484KT02_9ASTE|nr:unnamed protein product [Cuscuta campestris]